MRKISRPRFQGLVTLLAFLSLAVSTLDLMAIYLFAHVLTAMINVQDLILPSFLSFNWFGFQNSSRETKYSAVLLTVVLLVILKSILILLLSRKTLKFLATEYAKSSKNILTRLCQLGISHIRESATYEIFMAINSGVKDIYVVGFNALINIFVESILILTLFILVLQNGGMPTLILSIYFVLAFLLIGKITGKVNSEQSSLFTQSNLRAAVTIQSLVESFREIRVFNSFDYFFKDYGNSVTQGARSSAKVQFAGYIPKLIIESTFIVGVAFYAWFEIYTGNIANAVVEISFFIAMGSRMIPSLLRLQFGISQLRQVQGNSVYTQNLLGKKDFTFEKSVSPEVIRLPKSGTVELELASVFYRYPNANQYAIDNLSLELCQGESLGIVGRTGSGKSTLADLILGNVIPTSGFVSLRNESPETALKFGSATVGFVPQEISLIDGTIIDNLLLGRDPTSYSQKDFLDALDFAGLAQHIDSLELGLLHCLTRSGSELSGGQKQKLGIARAVLDKPTIIVLDEASSSLDQESESYLNSAIESLNGKVTLIIIAHRLTSVRNLDKVILLDKGELVAMGNFKELESNNQTFRDFVRYSNS